MIEKSSDQTCVGIKITIEFEIMKNKVKNSDNSVSLSRNLYFIILKPDDDFQN